jgi:hypothetical protein
MNYKSIRQDIRFPCNDLVTYMDIFTIILATKGADLVLSTSPPAARHVVASAFDRNAHGKQLVSVFLLLIN